MKKTLAIVAALVLAIALPGAAFAEGGNGSGGGNGGGGGTGSGSGTGGGSAAPLVVDSASIEDGATLDVVNSITLVFSKNVCDVSVREANLGLASVADADGNAVAATVVLADDQVEPEKRNDMVITFEQPLAAGTYKLTAKAGITSKSGDSLAEDYVLTFTVGGSATAASAASEGSASADSASASAPAASTDSTSTGSSSTASGSTTTQQEGGLDIVSIVVAAIIIIGVVGGFVVLRRKH